MIALTPEEREFLAGLLNNMQIQGTPMQVRETLRLVEGIQKKLVATNTDVIQEPKVAK